MGLFTPHRESEEERRKRKARESATPPDSQHPLYPIHPFDHSPSPSNYDSGSADCGSSFDGGGCSDGGGGGGGD
jgi:uncharacterized membrane protein YgcG